MKAITQTRCLCTATPLTILWHSMSRRRSVWARIDASLSKSEGDVGNKASTTHGWLQCFKKHCTDDGNPSKKVCVAKTSSNLLDITTTSTLLCSAHVVHVFVQCEYVMYNVRVYYERKSCHRTLTTGPTDRHIHILFIGSWTTTTKVCPWMH